MPWRCSVWSTNSSGKRSRRGVDSALTCFTCLQSPAGAAGDFFRLQPPRSAPATPEDLADALAFALRFDGRNPTRSSICLMTMMMIEAINR